MKLKQIAAVVALAAASVPSFASIATPSTGNGELFVAIYDAADQASYTLDLGLFVNDFNGNSTYSYTLNSANWNAFVLSRLVVTLIDRTHRILPAYASLLSFARAMRDGKSV